jgi:hypothetical protein
MGPGNPEQPLIRSSRSPKVIGVAAPLAALALVYLVWWISDRLVFIGPVDRATFGWLVVVPLWALAPLVAAYAWRTLETEVIAITAAAVGMAILAAAALLFWLAIAFPNCDFMAVRTPLQALAPSVIVGWITGAGFAAACLVTVAVLRGGRWWSALLVSAGPRWRSPPSWSVLPSPWPWAAAACPDEPRANWPRGGEGSARGRRCSRA